MEIVYREEFNKCVTDLGISRTGYTPQYFNEGFVRKIWAVAEQTLIKDNLNLRTKIERALAELKKEYQCEDGSDCSRINVLRAIKALNGMGYCGGKRARQALAKIREENTQ